MRHPFDRILPSDENEQQPAGASRRQMLQWMAGASAVPWAMHLASAASAAEEGEAASGEEQTAEGFGLYFVVPVTFKSFGVRRRADLGVQGNYLPGLPANEELESTKGYLAWLSEEQAQGISGSGDVKLVHKIESADVATQGAPPETGTATLRVFAAPDGWNKMPGKGTFEPVDAMTKSWVQKFSMHEDVKIVANRNVRTPFVQFADATKIPENVVATIKEHPQVYAVQWLTPARATTLALGEEGGGGVTTQALGEEGGITTKALGEEGGPRPSTRALGEEGGRPRPQPTTLALGEEGGIRPRPIPKTIPRPLPDATTQALGEEGGGRGS